MKTTAKISINVPRWWLKAVDKAAADKAMDRTNYIRWVVTEQLREDGYIQQQESKASRSASEE